MGLAAQADQFGDSSSRDMAMAVLRQEQGGPPAHYDAAGLVVRFFQHPVLNTVKSFGGTTVLRLPGRDEESRKAEAEKQVAAWGCGARLLGVRGRVQSVPGQSYSWDDHEVEVEGAGRPWFDPEDYVFIAKPGDNLNIIKRPVWNDPRAPNSDVSRFPEHWKRYKAGLQQQAAGTPLEQCPALASAEVASLKALNPPVDTVEQLAGLGDDICARYMGLTGLKQRAQVFLDTAQKGAAAQQLVTKNQELTGQLATLQAQFASQQAQMAEMSKAMEALQRAAAEAQKPNGKKQSAPPGGDPR